jgi:hypothetical protein
MEACLALPGKVRQSYEASKRQQAYQVHPKYLRFLFEIDGKRYNMGKRSLRKKYLILKCTTYFCDGTKKSDAT